MTTEEIQQKARDIAARFQVERDELAKLVYAQREFPDGCHVRRIRYNEDGSVYDDVTGVIVGARVHDYDFQTLDNGHTIGGYPNIYYGVRVISPVDYKSRQSSMVFDVEMDKYEDFWQGNKRWTKV